eukprot:gene33267-46001_t
MPLPHARHTHVPRPAAKAARRSIAPFDGDAWCVGSPEVAARRE